MNRVSLAFCPQEKERLQDRCLRNVNCVGIGDDLDLPIVELCRRLEAEGVECHTYDMRPLKDFAGFLFFEMPASDNPMLLHAKSRSAATFLIVEENHFIHSRNADFDRYGEFTAVFTYNDDAVARGLAIKLNYALSLSLPPKEAKPFAERKLAVMISSRVKKNRPHLCAYLRLRTARFYESNHPEDFDLFGPAWDKGTYWLQEYPAVYQWISALHLQKLLPRHGYPKCWRGTVERKRQVIGEYRFTYCYENTMEIPGYITEKIFDVMMSGSVPIYIGHPSSADVIPRECFVDRASFADDAALYDFISQMDEETWLGYMDAARRFLSSHAAQAFSVAAYVNTVSNVICATIKQG